MDNNKVFVNNFINTVSYTTSGEQILPYSGAKTTLIGMLFLKTLLAQPKLANISNNDDDWATILSFAPTFLGTERFNADALRKTLNMVAKNYDLPPDILEIDSLKKHLSEHSGALRDSFRDTELSWDIDFTSVLADLISRPQDSRDTANTCAFYTNESLQHLAAEILKVNKSETFMDCCCGMFSSALYNNAANYIGIELNRTIAGIAAMILIMCKKTFSIKNEDFIKSNYENVAEKIFAHIPYGVDVPKLENRPYGKNGEAYCIANVMKAMKDGGKAVVVCSGSILVKQDTSKMLRESITKDHLKAVIALPPMSYGTKSNTNLIILEKNCHAKEIKFINASNLEIENQNRMTLNESDITDIIRCFEGKKSSNQSKNIKVEDILNSPTISWAPQNYVGVENTTVTRTIEEIDKDLVSSYKELKKLLLG